MNLEAGWQTLIRIRRTELGRANSKIRMEPEASEEGQSNAAGKNPLTEMSPCSGSLEKAKVWHKGKFSHDLYTLGKVWVLTDVQELNGD